MFYSQVILAKKGPLAKVWMAAHWGDKKLARPQIFATDIGQSVEDIVNPSVPLALRVSGHLLLGVVRIYSRKVKYVLSDCTEAMAKLQLAFAPSALSGGGNGSGNGNGNGGKAGGAVTDPHALLLLDQDPNGAGGGGAAGASGNGQILTNFGEYQELHIVEGFCLPLPDENEWILAEDDGTGGNNLEDNLLFATQSGGSIGGAGGSFSGAGATGGSFGYSGSSGGAAAGGAVGGSFSLGDGSGSYSSQAAHNLPQEETWAPFDPNDEDDDEDEDGNNDVHGSLVSDVEVARAADDSFLSQDQTRRASSLLIDPKEGAATAQTEGEQKNNGDDGDDDFGAVPFDANDGDDSLPPAGPADTPLKDDSLLNVSGVAGGSGVDDSLNISGLNDSSMLDETMDSSNNNDNNRKRSLEVVPADDDDDDQQQPAPKRPRRRRRRRRKVIIDNDETELPNEHIRNMIANTDDIVSKQTHPAEPRIHRRGGRNNNNNDDDDDETNTTSTNSRGFMVQEDEETVLLEAQRIWTDKAKFQLYVTRPFLADNDVGAGAGDNDTLHPQLVQLWKGHWYRALDEDCPFEKDEALVQAREEPADDVEAVRDAGADNEDDDDALSKASDVQLAGPEKKPAAEGEEEEKEEDEPVDFAMEEESEDGSVVNFPADHSDSDVGVAAQESNELADLGLVNELDLGDENDGMDDEDDENREAIGDMSSTKNKWHKHTVKVLSLLQRRMKPIGAVAKASSNNNDDDDDSEEDDRPSVLQFDDIAKHCTRRTAASVFFEMLQLKTWDFIELEQDEPYGNIDISPGVRFEEAPPNRA